MGERTGTSTAKEHGVALLNGWTASETRSGEAVEIFGALGAVMLLRRFEEQWSGGAAAGPEFPSRPEKRWKAQAPA